MYAAEETKALYNEFFEKPELGTLVVSLTPGGGLQTTLEWPASLKSKACYFVKRNREALTRDANLRSALLYGDLSQNPIDQLSVFVEDVRTSVFICQS